MCSYPNHWFLAMGYGFYNAPSPLPSDAGEDPWHRDDSLIFFGLMDIYLSKYANDYRFSHIPIWCFILLSDLSDLSGAWEQPEKFWDTDRRIVCYWDLPFDWRHMVWSTWDNARRELLFNGSLDGCSRITCGWSFEVLFDYAVFWSRFGVKYYRYRLWT